MRIFHLLFFISICSHASTQNLLVNNGFEDLNVCTEYHATCAPEGWFYMRPANNPLVNAKIPPRPLLGNNLLLLPMYDITYRSKPLVYTMLLCPLQKGKQYKMSFYLHTAGKTFYNIDIAFLQKEPMSIDFDPYSVIPDLKIASSDIVAEIKGWQAVELVFTATGDARFMLIGNINSFGNMKYKAADGMNRQGMIYYFVDEIVLRPLLPESPCKSMESNRSRIYRQDFRHTEYALVEDEPIVDSPRIIIDTLVLPSVLFKTGSAVIDPKFSNILDTVLAQLAQRDIQAIQVVGHTDNKGKYENNIVLSQNRAVAVKDHLLSGLSIKNIDTDGKADTVPVADNTTETGRAKNRRVEIIVSYLQKE